MNIDLVRNLLDELEAKRNRLDAGAQAWSQGTDQCAMADCDPGIQFELSTEIEAIEKQIRYVVGELE